MGAASKEQADKALGAASSLGAASKEQADKALGAARRGSQALAAGALAAGALAATVLPSKEDMEDTFAKEREKAEKKKKEQKQGTVETWVSCDDCGKWRRANLHVSDLGNKWSCDDNPDKRFDSCNKPQELSEEQMNAVLGLDFSADAPEADAQINEEAVNAEKRGVQAAHHKGTGSPGSPGASSPGGLSHKATKAKSLSPTKPTKPSSPGGFLGLFQSPEQAAAGAGGVATVDGRPTILITGTSGWIGKLP